MDFLTYIQAEWAVISEAPLTFVTGALLLSALAYGVARVQFSDRLSSLNERLRLKEDRLADFEKNTGSQSPDEARRKIAELEKRLEILEPRSLSSDQVNILREVVGKSSGQISIVRDMGSADSVKLTSQIEGIFRSTKWVVNSSQVLGLGFHPPSGMLLTIYEDGSREDANLVKSSIDAAEVSYDLMTLPKYPLISNGFQPCAEILITSVP